MASSVAANSEIQNPQIFFFFENIVQLKNKHIVSFFTVDYSKKVDRVSVWSDILPCFSSILFIIFKRVNALIF